MVLLKINIASDVNRKCFFFLFLDGFFFFSTRQDKEWRKDSVAGFFYLSTGDGRVIYHTEVSHGSLWCVSSPCTDIKFILCLLLTFSWLVDSWNYRNRKMYNSRLPIMFEHRSILNHQWINKRIHVDISYITD